VVTKNTSKTYTSVTSSKLFGFGALKMQNVKMTHVKLHDIKLSHILIVLLCYVSDRMFSFLLNTNCFDELFFALYLMSYIDCTW